MLPFLCFSACLWLPLVFLWSTLNLARSRKGEWDQNDSGDKATSSVCVCVRACSCMCVFESEAVLIICGCWYWLTLGKVTLSRATGLTSYPETLLCSFAHVTDSMKNFIRTAAAGAVCEQDLHQSLIFFLFLTCSNVLKKTLCWTSQVFLLKVYFYVKLCPFATHVWPPGRAAGCFLIFHENICTYPSADDHTFIVPYG